MTQQSGRSPWWTVLGILAGLGLVAGGAGFVLVLNVPRYQPTSMLVDGLIEHAKRRPIRCTNSRVGVRVDGVRSEEMRELRRRHGPSLEIVLPLLEHRDPDVVVAALRLREVTEMPRSSREWKPWLEKIREENLLRHADRRVRWVALMVLEGGLISVDQVKQMLNDSEPSIQQRMTRVLDDVLMTHFREAGYRKKLTLMLIDQLAHESSAVRRAAHDAVFLSMRHAVRPDSELAGKISKTIRKSDKFGVEEATMMRASLKRLIKQNRGGLDFGRTE